MTTTLPLTPGQLAARKAEIAQQQAADDAAVTESETALHLLADKIHNKAFAAGKTPSYADSLHEAASDLITQAANRKDFPAAALANLRRYAAASPTVGTEDPNPIAAAEQAAEAADANA